MMVPCRSHKQTYVDCRRRTHEMNVGGKHRDHVGGPTYRCYLGVYLFIPHVLSLKFQLDCMLA